MSLNKSLNKQVTDYLNTHPENLTGGYQEIANKFKCKYSLVEHIARNIRNSKKYRLNSSKTVISLDNNTKEGIHILSGCWHVPFQNKEMQKGLINLIKDLGDKVVGFHLLGDILDLSSLSKHNPNELGIPGITLGLEYKEGNKFLDSFESNLPFNIEKTFIYGNHEDRYFRHLKNIDNSKFADALPSPTQALNLKQRGYKIYEDWKEDFHQLGKLQLIHGEFCSKNPARTHIDKMKTSVAFVHTHRVDTCFDGEKAGFNIGWGGDSTSPAFSYVSRLIRMNWINGFALCHIDKDQNYYIQVIPIYNNKFYYNGKQY